MTYSPETVLVPKKSREWLYFPIVMPLTADGKGPANVGEDAAKLTWEVWDLLCETYGSFDCLPDAIDLAIRLNQEDPAKLKGYLDESLDKPD